MLDAYYFGDDFAKANDVVALTSRVTNANVKAAARRMLIGKPHVLVVLRPEPPPPIASTPAPRRSE